VFPTDLEVERKEGRIDRLVIVRTSGRSYTQMVIMIKSSQSVVTVVELLDTLSTVNRFSPIQYSKCVSPNSDDYQIQVVKIYHLIRKNRYGVELLAFQYLGISFEIIPSNPFIFLLDSFMVVSSAFRSDTKRTTGRQFLFGTHLA
jgi:hypothetical protein